MFRSCELELPDLDSSKSTGYPYVRLFGLRKFVVIKGQPFYSSSGFNSGYPNVWFPFILIRGTQPINYSAFPSYYMMDNLENCKFTHLGYIIKFETNTVVGCQEGLFKGANPDKDELAGRLPTKDSIILSARLSGKNFPLDRLKQVDFTLEEEELIKNPILIEEHPEFDTNNPDRINKWLIEQGASVPHAVLINVTISLEDNDIIRYIESLMTPLMIAVEKNQKDVILQFMLHNNPKKIVNQCRSDGWSPLMLAAGMGHVEVVALLLENGADSDHCLPNGMTAFSIASANGRLNVVKQLMHQQNVMDFINQTDHAGWSALMLAAKKGHKDVVTLLLREGANVRQQLPNGKDSLAIAIDNGHTDLVDLLSIKKNNDHQEPNLSNQLLTTSKDTLFSADKNIACVSAQLETKQTIGCIML